MGEQEGKDKEPEGKDKEKEGTDKEKEVEDKPKKDGEDGTAAATSAAATEPQGPLTDEQVDDELQKESQTTLDEITRILAEKNKGYPEVKPDGEGDAKDEQADGTAAKEAGKDSAEKKEKGD